MRAAVLKAYGGLENVVVDDVPAPVIEQPNDVLVRVRAAALNHLDLFVVGGMPGLTHRFPHVLGADGAGIVEAVGDAVTRVKPGDRVLLNPGFSCGHCEYCLADQQPLCANYGILGEHGPGTFAELARVREASVEKLADGIAWTDAAAFPLVALTAWGMLVSRAALKKGETVLIWGIGGGVALAALRIAKLIGARVIVTSGSDAKLARAKDLGADETINHQAMDVGKEVRRLTNKRGCDVVVDNVGQKTWEMSLRSLGKAGRLVTCGGTSGPMVTTDVRKLFWYQWTIMGSTMGGNRAFAELVRHFGNGELKPVVDRVYPLAEARAALERMRNGEQFGKIVLDLGELA